MCSLVDQLGGQQEAAGGRVLVVDDDAALRSELVVALETAGFSTVAAAHTDEALATIAVNPDITVVLSDIHMPGRNGIALAEQLRAVQSPHSAVEVVLMSGHAGLDEALSAVRASAFDLLRKPFRLTEVATVVGRATARARTRRQAAIAVEQARLEREALFLAAPIGFGRIGRDLRISGANPILAKTFGIEDGADSTSLCEQVATFRDALELAIERIFAGDTAQAATSVRIEIPRRPGAAAFGLHVLDLRLYPVLDCEDRSRVVAVGLACLDVTAEVTLLRELDHRVKNAFAVFVALVQGAARHAAGRDAASMAAELVGRVLALSRAHDLVRLSVSGLPGGVVAEGTTMRILVETVLGPHRSTGPEQRVSLQGPEVALGPKAAPGLALVLHELATNSLKHGALSAPGGRVELTWTIDDNVATLDWQETGGPPVAGPPAHTGFGLRLIGQVDPGGVLLRTALDWSNPAGLQARIRLPLAVA